MISKMYETEVEDNAESVEALKAEILQKSERSFNRIKPFVYLFFTLLGLLLYWLISAFFNREVPLEIYEITTPTKVVSPGDPFEFRVKALKMWSGCTGVAKRQILDSENNLVIVNEYTLAGELKPGPLEFDRKVVIPSLVTYGNAHFLYEIRYYCNWTHADWLMGPVISKAPPLPLTIVPKPDTDPVEN